MNILRHFSFQNTFHYGSGYWSDKSETTFPEGRLGLMHRRPSYRPTGTHPSPRSVLVWRSANRLTSLSSTSRPTLCTQWSLMTNTAPPHWDVTRGRRWLGHRPPYRSTVTRKGSMLWVLLLPIRKQESASLITSKMTAVLVIPESGLVQEGILMTPTRVETLPLPVPCVTSWCSKTKTDLEILETSRRLPDQ